MKRRKRVVRALPAGAALLVLAGCSTPPLPSIAPGPERAWRVPDSASYAALAARRDAPVSAPDSAAAAPPRIDEGKAYELAELIDIAERTNPETRIAWERAREAALAAGIAHSVYAPMLSAKAAAASQRISSPLPKTALNPQGFFVADTQFFLPGLTLKWLLFDFGGRQATLDATQEAVVAASFGFNATHQKIVLDVTRAYYALGALMSRVDVATASFEEARTLQDASESRRGRGLATLPEVLLARERTARAAYELQEAISGVTDARMLLLEAMGVRPTTPLRVAGIAGRELPAMVEQTADALVDRAVGQRPDLLAHVAQVREREAEVRKAQSEFYPRIVLGSDLVQNMGRVRTQDIPGWSHVNETGYGVAIAIELPLLDGGLRRQRLAEAQSKRRVAESELELARDRTERQVVKAYEDLKVATRQREAAVALLEAARKSYDASFDSYRNGVATFVDVTTAQTALARARTADTETRSAVLTATAALAFATGDLASPVNP